MAQSSAGREQVRELNRLIDHALREHGKAQVPAMLAIAGARNFQALAERVRRRSASLIRQQTAVAARPIQDARDRLMQLVYAQAAPAGWYCAWSDASRSKGEDGYSTGIGGLLMDPQGHLAGQFSRSISDRPPFEGEIAALAVALEAGLEHHAEHIVAHTDCDALASLWLRGRNDPRLERIRYLAGQYKRVKLRSIPRLHNQPANLLARRQSSKPATHETDADFQ
jgi:hypothetical protein